MHSGTVARWLPRLQAVCLEEAAEERRSQGRPAGVPLIAFDEARSAVISHEGLVLLNRAPWSNMKRGARMPTDRIRPVFMYW